MHLEEGLRLVQRRHPEGDRTPIDTSTAPGKCFLDMLGVFAEFETNLRREPANGGHREGDGQRCLCRIETYFAELAAAGDSGRNSELAAKYGLTYSSDWLPTLISRYQLKLLRH